MYSRRNTYAIDTVDYDFHVIDTAKEPETKPEVGVYIKGLFLEGVALLLLLHHPSSRAAAPETVWCPCHFLALLAWEHTLVWYFRVAAITLFL